MSLSSAILTGFSGIQTNSVTVDTVGDNLANSNTTSFKGQRTLFETLMYRNMGEGTGPTDSTGGTLPQQVGTGASVSAIQRNFKQGSVEGTGYPSDLAIDGKGFFILEGNEGETLYTRDGSFHLDSSNTLTNSAGRAVQAFQPDADGNIQTGTLGNLVIPIGSSSAPVATTNVIMDGKLSADGEIASGAELTSQVFTLATGGVATDGTSLTSLVDANGVPLFSLGDEILVNARKGGISMPESTFVVGTTGSTLRDFADHLQTNLGINTDATLADGAGITIENGAMVVRSNIGAVNAVELESGTISNVTNPSGSLFDFTTTTPSTGEAVTTSFNVFDSLGNPVEVRTRFALESKSNAGTVWRFFSESTQDTDASPILGTGTVNFDQNGRFLAATGTTLSIDRANTGATTPMTFELDLSGVTGHAAAGGASQLIMDTQDGRESGIMSQYRVDLDGTVVGVYSNESEEILGQVALATFVNEEGLIAQSGNVFVEGPGSGEATVLAPETGVGGSIVQSALEKSNVEIAREFVDLISAQTGISSSGRVVRVADELLSELMLLAR